MSPNPQETADLVTFTEDILNGKRYFLSSVRSQSISYLVQLSWTFFPIVTKTCLIFVFLKTGFKNGNLRILPADFTKHAFIESVLDRLPLR